MDLKIMQDLCHNGSEANGWWDGILNVDAVFCEKLVLMHSELSEALEEYRKGSLISERYYRKANGSKCFVAHDERGNPNKPEGIPSELADCIIRILDLAGAAGIDMNAVIMEKLQFNATRGHRHGGKVI